MNDTSEGVPVNRENEDWSSELLAALDPPGDQPVEEKKLLDVVRGLEAAPAQVQGAIHDWLSSVAPTAARLAAATVCLEALWTDGGRARPEVVEELLDCYETLRSHRLAAAFRLHGALSGLDPSRLSGDLSRRIEELREDAGLPDAVDEDLRDETPTLDIPVPRIAPATEDIPFITVEDMVAVDRALTEQCEISLEQMMEIAGRSLADLGRSIYLDGDARDRRVVVLVGRGGNGGGALVAARRLHGWGAKVTVALVCGPDRFEGAPARQLRIVRKLGIRVGVGVPPSDAPDLVIDGVLGYGLDGAPRADVAELIAFANQTDTPIVSLDGPSGVDLDSGEVHTPAVVADTTMTLALPKRGLRGATEHVGELYLADIGVPRSVLRDVGYDVGPIFGASDVVRIW